MFVVGELKNVGQRVALAAVLRGGYVTVPSTLINGHGPGVKYCSALSSRRKIWMTDEFTSKHQALSTILREAAADARGAGDPMQWKFLHTEASYKEAKRRAKASNATTSVLGVATIHEQKAGWHVVMAMDDGG